MSFLAQVLDPPSYGYVRNSELYVPTRKEILHEFFSRLNIFTTRKNWLALFSWSATLSLFIPFFYFLTHYASLPLMIAGFLYSMVILGSHGTFWLHRYSTHRAYKFKQEWVKQICRNLVPRVIPEEIYVVSHYVHHQFSEQPGDPYNARAGFLYCFLADVNHQSIRRDLSEKDYASLCKLMDHTGVKLNSYAQYQRYGTLCHPFRTISHYILNWGFWFGAFYLIGGFPLATALMGWAGIWAIGVRTFNFEGHGRGKDRRRDGVDFNRSDWSINQTWPGLVSGEWHNNHHLYPSSARCGFLKNQLDIPWLWISGLSKLGLVSGVVNQRDDFFKKYYNPWVLSHSAKFDIPKPIHAEAPSPSQSL